MNRLSSRRLPRKLLLAGNLALLPALAAHAGDGSPPPTASAGATLAVANCNDSGPGSLRSAVAAAASGDTIDMSGLACRRIDLTSGAIAVAQRDLSLLGGPPGAMIVDAGRRSSVFRHSGRGTLSIKRLDIARGLYRSNADINGGCLYSAGNVELVDSIVRGCRAIGIRKVANAAGGGIFAMGTVKLVSTRVLDNAVVAIGYGGAIFAGRGLTAFHSRICNNWTNGSRSVVFSQPDLTLRYTTYCDNRGSIDAQPGSVLIADSTITGNTGGSLLLFGYPSGSMSIVNSTFSGNTDSVIQMDGKSPKSITNSTIAFNELALSPLVSCDPPWAVVNVGGPEPVLLDSTIISNNSCNGVPSAAIHRRQNNNTFLIGANNLIMGASDMPLPADTLNVDPQLAPLADNGGPTLTHALMQGSPAIDNGNNEAGLDFDQRGVGHPRVNGAQADIGAFER
jgi:hypothetical protein